MKKINKSKKERVKKLSQIQILQLEHLEQIVGSHHGPIMCPDCNDRSE